MSKPTRVSALVLSVLMFSHLVPLTGAQHPAEDTSFTPPHDGVDFPVGWDDVSSENTPYPFRLMYPAMSSGSGVDMAGNGPFPHIQFLIDTGESSDSYMDFASRIVERGYIVAVHSQETDSTEYEEILERIEFVHNRLESLNASSSGPIEGSFGQFDTLHWGLAGHGVGAAAAYGILPFWQNSTLYNSTQPPRAMFGLGSDFEDWQSKHWDDFSPNNWTVNPASPSTGLFFTGTADEVSPTSEVESTLTQGKGLGWQLVEIIGADHYQFQDSTSFFEGLGDGDATLTQDEQNQFAAEHAVSYLDLMIRGSHQEFRVAFNRPLGPHVVSDSGAYIVENLLESSFLLVHGTSTAPANSSIFGPEITVNYVAEWNLRDGRNFSEMPGGWDAEIQCTVLGMDSTTGSFDASGDARCLFPMEDVAPGPHTARMQIFVEGAPSTMEFSFVRTDSPLVIVEPAPRIDVEQRGSIHVNASDFAYDPDGVDILIDSAEFVGGSSEDFSYSIDSNGRGITVTHAVNDESVGGTELLLSLRADDDGVVDEGVSTPMVRVIPVDDAPVKIANVPTQNLVEDGFSLTVNLSQYVQDPEGEMLLATIGGETSGVYGPVTFSIADGRVTLAPISNMNGATILRLLVSDGVNVPVELDVPAYVEPIDDAIIVNSSNWSFSLNEDESHTLNISDLAWDVDGDNLFWTIESTSQSVLVTRSVSQLVITPSLDFSGYDDLTNITVDDGTTTYTSSLKITVNSSPDAPVLSLQELNIIDSTAGSLQWWVYDADGVIPEQTVIQVNSSALENLTHSCVYDQNTLTNRCLTMLPLPAEHNGTIVVRVSVFDEEIGSESVAYLTLNLTASNPVIIPPPTAAETTGVSLGALTAVGFIVSVVLVLLVVMIRRSSTKVEVNESVFEKIIEVEEEPVSELATGGLLARAQGKM